MVLVGATPVNDTENVDLLTPEAEAGAELVPFSPTDQLAEVEAALARATGGDTRITVFGGQTRLLAVAGGHKEKSL